MRLLLVVRGVTVFVLSPVFPQQPNEIDFPFENHDRRSRQKVIAARSDASAVCCRLSSHA